MMSVLCWVLQAKLFAQGKYVLEITFTQFVAGVPLNLPVRWNALDPLVANSTYAIKDRPLKNFRIFGRAVKSIPGIVEVDDVHIYFAALVIAHHEIIRPGYFQFYLAVAVRLKRFAEPTHVFLQDQNVQIGVRAGLPAEEGIDTPSTLDPDSDAQLLKLEIKL